MSRALRDATAICPLKIKEIRNQVESSREKADGLIGRIPEKRRERMNAGRSLFLTSDKKKPAPEQIPALVQMMPFPEANY